MAHILILGGGAAGLAAALAAAQAAPSARVTVLERNPKVGKKLLATGNGRCNLDNTAIAPEKYFTADPAALRPLLAAVDAAAPLAWFEQLGLYTRTDEAGRVYPYSNQAADVLALLELHLQRHTVQLRTGCTVSTLRQSKGGYAVQFTNAEGGTESLRADAVICAMGGAAGPQFGTDGFGTRFAADCGGQLRPLYPCLTALQCAKPNKSLAGIRAKAAARLLDGDRVLAEEMGEVQFTDYGLSGICIMQLSGLLAPGRSPKHPAVELDLFPAVPETELAALFAARAPLLAEDTAAAFWLGLLHGKLGRALWAAAALPDTAPHDLPAGSWQKLARTAKHWRFEGLTPCGWRQAQTTGGGLALTEVEPTFQFKGCPGLYFVGETLDCAGSCGGFNLHWAFGSGLAAGQTAAVIGDGTIGLMTLIAAKSQGAQVCISGHHARPMQLAAQLGALDCAQLPQLTAERGADVVYDAVGSQSSFTQAMELVRKGGRIMVIGNHARTIDFPLQRCITEQIDVQFSYSSAGEYPVCLQAIAEGRAGLTGLWQSFPLAEGAQVFDRLVHRDESLTKAVLIP